MTRASRTRNLAAAAVLALLLAGCGDDRQKDATPGTPTRPPPGDPAAGKVIAERSCKGCHGLNGRGTAPAIPNLAAQNERYLYESTMEYREGKRTHAALKDMTGHMSETDVRNVVAFYASLPPLPAPSEAPRQPLSPYERGKALATGCASCHGDDGNSTVPGTPTLAGQQPRYFIAAMQEYHQGDRHTPATRSMLRVGGKLELESLALYFASQTPAKRPFPPEGDAAAGEPLTGVCGGCHGARGVSSDAATPNLAGQDARYLFAAIKAYGNKTRRHETMESQVAKLSDRDVRNIAAFYASQVPRAAERGHTLIQELADKCDRCHGAKVENPAMAVPKIHGQDKDYLVMALRAYRDDRRESSVMHRMSLPVSDAVIESLAGLYSSQPAR